MNNKNLKITLFFKGDSPLILNRYTTIDNILLSAFYGYKSKIGNPIHFDPEHKMVDFIYREKGVLSGSIWYIPKEDDIHIDYTKIVKNPEHEKNYKYTGKKTSSNKNFKMALIENEVLLSKRIYFYIRGSRPHIEALLANEVRSIGKFQRLGYGEVDRYEIEEIDDDRGFMLNETTPSKPLPVSDFDVKSKKIAYFKRIAPYWGKEGKEACYMPTTALIEVDDTTNSTQYSIAKNLDYITNVDFLFEQEKRISKDKKLDFDGEKAIKQLPQKDRGQFYYGVDSNSEKKRCVVSGVSKERGLHGDIKMWFKKTKSSFSDHNLIDNGNLISTEALWCIDNLKKLSFFYVDTKCQDWIYIRGKNAKEGNKLPDFLLNHKKFKPPFFVSIKKNQNPHHTSIKGEVSISNALIFLQVSEYRLQIDTQLLREAINDIEKITKKHKYITKTHLCGNFSDMEIPKLSKKANIEEDTRVIMDFQKRYNKDIRYLLFSVAYKK